MCGRIDPFGSCGRGELHEPVLDAVRDLDVLPALAHVDEGRQSIGKLRAPEATVALPAPDGADAIRAVHGGRIPPSAPTRTAVRIGG